MFSVTSPDGDEKYPGTVNASVNYTLNDENELKIVLKANTDKATIINFTNHAYVNLKGQVHFIHLPRNGYMYSVLIYEVPSFLHFTWFSCMVYCGRDTLRLRRTLPT